MAVKNRHQAASTSEKAASPEMTVLAWQRICVDVPLNWALTAISGDNGSGSIRVERISENRARFAPYGLDVRWSNKVKSSETIEMLDKRIKPLVDAAKRAAKNAGLEFLPELASKVTDTHDKRGEIREYSWRGSPAAVGRIWWCATCSRLIIAQVLGESGARFKSDAQTLLNNITCHNEHEDWTRWALYGLDVFIPSSYGLAKQQLMTTYLELRFGKLKGNSAQAAGDMITIEQWSAANVQLKGQYIDEWIERKSSALMATTEITRGEAQIHGHPALSLSGHRQGLGYWAGDGLKAVKALQKPAMNYDALAWECPESNKIYLVQQMHGESDPNVDQIAQSLRCHGRIESAE